MDQWELPRDGHLLCRELYGLRGKLTADPNGAGWRVTQTVVAAVGEVIWAAEAQNWPLVAQLLAVKAHIYPTLDVGPLAFGEDRFHNKATEDGDVCGCLGTLHSQVAIALGEMPASMTALHSDSTAIQSRLEEGNAESESPTLRRMAAEMARIREKVEQEAVAP